MLKKQFTTYLDEIGKLSPRNLISKNDETDYFICKICMKIVVEPEECSICQNTFCKDCLQDWSQRKPHMCPIQCQNPTYNKIHRFAFQNLKSQAFNCGNQECKQTEMKYDQALVHVKECEFNYYKCPNNCGQTVQGLQMKVHQHQECELATNTCTICEQKYYIKLKNEHDCLQLLKEKVRNYEKHSKQNQVKNVFKEEKQYKCDNNHIIKRHQGVPQTYINMFNSPCVQCDKCKVRNLEKHQYFYHCPDCQYDLCRACSLSWLLPNTLKVTLHEHNLTKKTNNQNNGWDCNGKSTPEQCYSGITEFYMSTHTQSWECRQCDFDLCINCCIVHKEQQ